jgi:Protein of unknown function (DUF2924)
MPRSTIYPASPDREKLDIEIVRLRNLDVGELRARWHTVFRRRAPTHLPRHLLFCILAYRLQADRLGDLDAETLQGLEQDFKRLKDSTAATDRDLVNNHIARVEVQAKRLAIKLARKSNQRANRKTDNTTFYIPWKKNTLKRRREVIVPTSSGQDVRPIRSEARVKLVTSIACGRRWLDEICTGSVPHVEEIAAREKCNVRQVNMTISLAFLSPTLVKAAIDGRLPRGIGVARLRDAPAEWSHQHAMLGLAS